MKLNFTLAAALGLLMVSCIDDSITNDSSAQPTFSTNEVLMAPLLPGQTSPTYKFVVYNPAGKGISIGSISAAGNDDGFFSFNVDGHSSDHFSDVVIRGGDSIYVFVQARADGDGSERSCSLNFSTSGTTRSVKVSVPMIQARVVEETTVDSDDVWSGNYYVKGNITVSAGASLTLTEGTNLYFTDGSGINVDGSLLGLGTAQSPVVMQGDRFDDIVPDVSYDMIAGQWSGISVSENASLNLAFTRVLNAETTVSIAPGGNAVLTNSVLHNATETVLLCEGATVEAMGCEITDAALNVVSLTDSEASFVHCTVSNHYLLSYPVDPMIKFEGDCSANFDNCIIYGLAPEINADYSLDNRPIYFRNSLFLSAGTDDDNFLSCIWDTDPELNVIRSDYQLDYRPLEGSPVFGSADESLTPSDWVTDADGNTVQSPAAIGCYQAPVL